MKTFFLKNSGIVHPSLAGDRGLELLLGGASPPTVSQPTPLCPVTPRPHAPCLASAHGSSWFLLERAQRKSPGDLRKALAPCRPWSEALHGSRHLLKGRRSPQARHFMSLSTRPLRVHQVFCIIFTFELPSGSMRVGVPTPMVWIARGRPVEEPGCSVDVAEPRVLTQALTGDYLSLMRGMHIEGGKMKNKFFKESINSTIVIYKP